MKRPVLDRAATLPQGRILRALMTAIFIALALFLMAQIPNQALGAAQAAKTDSAKQAMEMLDKGELAAAAGRFEEAARLWRGALEIKPGWDRAEARLAGLEQRKKRFPAQMAALERSSRARLAYVEGVEKFNQGDYQAAAGLFAQCLEVYPGDELSSKNLALARAMQRDMGQGSLQVACRPPGKVYVDGKPRGTTPLTLEQIPVGGHEVAVEAYGARAVKEIEIKPRTLSSVTLQLYGGCLEVTCQPQAEIWLDERSLGQSPFKMTGLPVGDHVLRASCPGYCEKKYQVRLEKGPVANLDINLSPNPKEK
jgi:tetratricopeptide (TPR) repeat protein